MVRTTLGAECAPRGSVACASSSTWCEDKLGGSRRGEGETARTSEPDRTPHGARSTDSVCARLLCGGSLHICGGRNIGACPVGATTGGSTEWWVRCCAPLFIWRCAAARASSSLRIRCMCDQSRGWTTRADEKGVCGGCGGCVYGDVGGGGNWSGVIGGGW